MKDFILDILKDFPFVLLDEHRGPGYLALGWMGLRPNIKFNSDWVVILLFFLQRIDDLSKLTFYHD
jgi:hypothetical protein